MGKKEEGSFQRVGGTGDITSPSPSPTPINFPSWFKYLSIASSAVCVYHGYKRNNGSIGWAIGWGFLGGLAPVITPAVAVAQGFGKPKKK